MNTDKTMTWFATVFGPNGLTVVGNITAADPDGATHEAMRRYCRENADVSVREFKESYRVTVLSRGPGPTRRTR